MRKFLPILYLVAAGPALAGSISSVGDLNALDANDVALIPFTLSSAADVNIQTWGYGGSATAPGGTNAVGDSIAAGGFDTYISLFSGIGNSGVFMASNDDGNCPPGDGAIACHDSTLNLSLLPAGEYTLTVSAFNNFSFAENYGSGTLDDGFIGLGTYYDVSSNMDRSSHYAVDILSDGLASPVPEPATSALLAAGLLAVTALRRRA